LHVSLLARISLRHLSILFNLSTGSDGRLTRVPASTTLIPGKLLRLNCSIYTPTDDVLWSFTAEASARSTDMTAVGYLLPEFEPYFYIDHASLYDLVARTSNANASYCGTYTCIDYRGTDDSRSATVASKCTIHLNVFIFIVRYE